MRSSSSTRFGSPVSGSRRAWRARSRRQLRRTAAATNAQHEGGDDVVGRLAEDSGEKARDEDERRQAERPHERALSCRRPVLIVTVAVPPGQAAAVTSDISGERATHHPRTRTHPRVSDRIPVAPQLGRNASPIGNRLPWTSERIVGLAGLPVGPPRRPPATTPLHDPLLGFRGSRLLLVMAGTHCWGCVRPRLHFTLEASSPRCSAARRITRTDLEHRLIPTRSSCLVQPYSALRTITIPARGPLCAGAVCPSSCSSTPAASDG